MNKNVNMNGYRLVAVPAPHKAASSDPFDDGKSVFAKDVLAAFEKAGLLDHLPSTLYEKVWIRFDQGSPQGARELAVYTIGTKKPVRLSKEISRKALRQAFELLHARQGFMPWPEEDGTLKVYATFKQVCAEN